LRPIRYSSDISKILCAYRIRRSWDPNVHIYLFLMNRIVYNTLHSFGFDLGACYNFLFNGHCVLIVLFPLLSHYSLPSRGRGVIRSFGAHGSIRSSAPLVYGKTTTTFFLTFRILRKRLRSAPLSSCAHGSDPLLSYGCSGPVSRHFRRLLPSGKLFFFELSCFGFLGLLTLFQI